MEDFGVFIYIALGVTVLLVAASILLKKSNPEKKDKYLNIAFYGLLILSIGIVIISLFVGGWSGMVIFVPKSTSKFTFSAFFLPTFVNFLLISVIPQKITNFEFPCLFVTMTKEQQKNTKLRRVIFLTEGEI